MNISSGQIVDMAMDRDSCLPIPTPRDNNYDNRLVEFQIYTFLLTLVIVFFKHQIKPKIKCFFKDLQM